VTPYNIVHLQTLVNNGPSVYPGARYYVKDTGERVDLKYRRGNESVSLQFGWIVERHLKDGESASSRNSALVWRLIYLV
jgi:DNA-directed RNA polymerase II subunit RPB1